MPAPEINPDLLTDVPDDGSTFGTTTRGNHATHGDAYSGGNQHIEKSCVVRQNIYCAKALEASAYTVRTSTYGDPEDPQFDDEHVYTTNIVEGFVKNDAAGNFLFGQPGDGSNGGVTALDQLDDVTLTFPAGREYLCFDSASSKWVNEVIQLDDLGDVIVTSPTDGQHLVFDFGTSTWINKNSNSLNDLDDVVLTSPANGEFLRFDGSDWVNAALVSSDLPAHSHVEADITDLQNYSLVGHTHVEADITDLQNYSLVGHTHVEADITDLQSYLLDITGQNLNDLADVNASSPTLGDHLEFDGSNWIAAAPGHTSPGASALNDLSDVTLSSLADANVLQFDGSVWVNRSDVELSSTSAYYLGDKDTDGTWRFVRNGSDLQVELRESSTYNVKGSFTP